MDSHYNAALTPRGRARMVRAVIDRLLSYRKAAELFHVDPKTVQRWTMDRIAMNMGISREPCAGSFSAMGSIA